MYSIKTLYKIGNGPSSSHTMGPKNAVLYILEHFPNADFYEMYVYESLALTGVGHLLDYIVEKHSVISHIKLFLILKLNVLTQIQWCLRFIKIIKLKKSLYIL